MQKRGHTQGEAGVGVQPRQVLECIPRGRSASNNAAEKVNHFRSNYALTTKDGLRSTLYQHAPAEIKVSRFYPRTYDMHSEFEEFEMDFNRTAMLNLLRKYLVYIETAAVSQPKQPKVSLEQLLKQGW